MSEIRVPAGETGVVRLFRIDLPAAEVERLESDASGGEPDGASDGDPLRPLREALGATVLDGDHVQIVPVEDLSAVGFSTYLTEGMGLPEEEIAPDRERLDAIRGNVLVVGSPAFRGRAQTLDPEPPLTPIGTYREHPSKPVIGSIESEAAKGRLAMRGQPVKHARSSPLVTLFIVVLALVCGAGIVFVVALGLG